MENLKLKTIRELASLIEKDWTSINEMAQRYLQAMSSINSVGDRVGMDTGFGIIGYFLANSHGWKGDVAKAMKKELKNRIMI